MQMGKSNPSVSRFQQSKTIQKSKNKTNLAHQKVTLPRVTEKSVPETEMSILVFDIASGETIHLKDLEKRLRALF